MKHKEMKHGIIIAAAVLLLAFCAAAAPAAAATEDVYLGDVYAWAVYTNGEDFAFDDVTISSWIWWPFTVNYFDIANHTVFTNTAGNTVTFLSEGIADQYYINGNNVEAEGDYFCDVGGARFHINVKFPTAAISGDVYKDAAKTQLVGALINSTVLNDKFIVVDGLGNGASVAFTSPDGTVTSINPAAAFGLDINGNTNLKAVDLGTWTVQAYFAKGASDVDVLGGHSISHYAPAYILGAPYYFTVVSSDIAKKLESTSSEVVEGGYVTVILTAPSDDWDVSVENGIIPAGQPLVSGGADNVWTISVPESSIATFSVQATTASDLKVKLLDDQGKTIKSLTIRVKAGQITAAADRSSVCIGEDFDLSGTNDFGGTLYFLIKGTNYPLSVIEDWGSYLTAAGKIWDATIDTANIKRDNGKKIDAGTYTVYVVSNVSGIPIELIASNEDNLDDSTLVRAYTRVSIAFKQPFITIDQAPEVLVQGEKLVVKGTATGDPAEVQFYIFGTNYFRFGSASVTDGTYSVEIAKTLTTSENMAAGQYFLIIQHPMYDKVFNIGYDGETSIVLNEDGSFTESSYVIFDVNKRQSANAAQALCDALDSQNIDDMYAKASFIVTGATSYIDPIPSQITKGQVLTISGFTTGHKGDVVSVELLSTAFAAIPKEAVGSASFVALTTTIGDDGVWSISFDTSSLNADTYTCSVAVGQLDATTSRITIVDNGGVLPTITPTPTPTPVPSGGGFTVVKEATIDPPGSLVPGETVTGTVEIKFMKGSIDDSSYVLFNSPLVGDVWNVDIIKGGVVVLPKTLTSTSSADFSISISGFDLNYDADVTLRINMSGTVSSASAGSGISVIQIKSYGVSANGAYYSPQQFVYNTGNLNGELAVLGNAITTLDTRIASYAAYERDVSKAQSYTEQARAKYNAAVSAGTADAATAFRNIEEGNALVKQAQMELALTSLSMSLSYTTAVDEKVTALYSKGSNAEAMLVDTKNTGLKNTYNQLLSVYNTGNTPDAAALDKLAADSLALWEEADGYLNQSTSTTLQLRSGWNFISVPTKLGAANDTAAELFGSVNTGGKAVLSYNAKSQAWEQAVASTVIEPLNAYWIYSVDDLTLTPEFDRGAHTPSMMTLKKGWNGVGLSAESAMPANVAFNGLNWRTYFSWNAAGQKYDNPVIKGMSGTYGEENPVSLWKGGWIYMEEDGTYLGYA